MPFSGWDEGEKGRVEGLWENRPDTYEDVWGEVVGFMLRSNEEGQCAAAGPVAPGKPGLYPAPAGGSDQCQGVVTGVPQCWSFLALFRSTTVPRPGPGYPWLESWTTAPPDT